VKISVLAMTSMFVATVAMAQAPYTAALAQPLAEKKEFIANHNFWHCEDSTCTLRSQPQDPTSILSCRELQRRVGDLTAYGTKEAPFTADKLAKCNSKG
jgi:hypothetical protein